MHSQKFDYFILLANMRTGSNLFEQTMEHFVDISCLGELFNPAFIGGPRRKEFSDYSLTDREKDPFALLNLVISRYTDTLPGFRFFCDHDPRILEFALHDESCAKIILKRNPLDSFVSHQIALKTDQWRIGDMFKYRPAKVEFELEPFRKYLQKLRGFDDHIRHSLQSTGQAGFHLDYSDLGDLEVFNGLAHFLGSSEKLEELNRKIKKQNPHNLSEKVSNYKEMVKSVKSLDFFATGQRSNIEPKAKASVSDIRCWTHTPLAFFPINEQGRTEILGWMQQHETNARSKIENPPAAREKIAFPQWQQAHSQRRVFTYLCHPAERAYHAFYQTTFLYGAPRFRQLRRSLIKRYTVNVPDPELCNRPDRMALEAENYTLDQHRTAFLAFLAFLQGNLQGRTQAAVLPVWTSQTAKLSAICDTVAVDLVLRPERPNEGLSYLESSLGLENTPKPEFLERARVFSLAEVYNTDVEDAVRQVYHRDYENFGFQNWQ